MKSENLIELRAVKSAPAKTAGGLLGPALAAAAAHVCAEHKGVTLVIAADSGQAQSLAAQLAALLPGALVKNFPDYETLPYDQLSPHQDIISARLELLAQLPYLEQGIIISSVTALLGRLCPTDYIQAQAFILKCGDRRDLPALRAALTAQGYLQVED